MSLKEKIENNPALWALGMLLAGFLAGVGAYKGVLEIAKLQVVSKAEYDSLTAIHNSNTFEPNTTENQNNVSKTCGEDWADHGFVNAQRAIKEIVAFTEPDSDTLNKRYLVFTNQGCGSFEALLKVEAEHSCPATTSIVDYGECRTKRLFSDLNIPWRHSEQ